MRINKYIASCNIASRRKAEEMILEGKVSVNDILINDLATQISETDIVKIDGKPINLLIEKKYYMLNKPPNYVSTAKDQFSRACVVDFFDKTERVYPVGRLDYESRGLLLITNDGELTYALTHPKYHIEKKYIVKVDSKLTSNEELSFITGVDIGGYITAKCKLKYLNNNDYEVIIKEGKNRQIRKMFNSFEKNVVDLKRVAIGRINLENLKEGSYRILSQDEIVYLKEMCNII